jgi:RNA polymerase sigma-70 factor (ECF subfamily)
VASSTVPSSTYSPTLQSVRKPDPFADVFATHSSFVWRVLRRLGVPDADAEDALQEIFLVVHQKLDQYEERGSMRAWLFAIARQVASHHRRTEARRQRRQSAPQSVAPGETPHEAAMRREAAALVRDFLADLDEGRAMVFFLAEVEGMSCAEIASSLGVNLNTVYGRLRASRSQFEEFLEKSGRKYEDR